MCLFSRFVTLTTGIYVFNDITEAVAIGSASYDVPASGTSGRFMISSQVFNGQKQYIFQNSGMASWYSPSSWSNEGVLAVSSAANVYGTPYNWNATGAMTYGANQYSLVGYENDYGVSAYTSDVTSNEFYIVGSGSYGGSNWNNW